MEANGRACNKNYVNCSSLSLKEFGLLNKQYLQIGEAAPEAKEANDEVAP